MIYYYIFATILLTLQFVILLEAGRHFKFTYRKYKPKPSGYHPKTALICPCKGIDTAFEKNMNSLFGQDHPDYEIYFVVESESDLAYGQLKEYITGQQAVGNKIKASVTVAGPARNSSQKVHNLLTVVNSVPEEVKILAFVDSDACLKSHFLTSLIHPLRVKSVGAATGYRWYVPTDRRISSFTLSAANAFFASTLGPHPRNSVWGGATALKRKNFFKLGIDKLWAGALSDDYAVTHAVKQAKLEVKFVPTCFVASYEQMSWKELFGFMRRQFIITRTCKPSLWRLALAGYGQFLAGFWIGLITSVILWKNNSPHTQYVLILPATIYAAEILKACMRQYMIRKILPEDKKSLAPPAVIDIFLQPLLSIFIFITVAGAATTRSVVWRGKKYTIIAIDKTRISR